MAIYQIFVKLLDGRTQCLQISSPIISGETLKRHLFAKTRIPHPFQRVISGSRIVSDETLIFSSVDGFFPSCVLLLRLPGGKGGFGSLLRGAATKAGQKKTNNFDACRDMSGRRLRHVNAEKKLEEWKVEAGDRRLEKLAEQFLKKKAKETKNTSVDVDKYLEKYREDSAKCMEEVEESVRHSFEMYKDLKRKICPASDLSSKRLKIWLGKNKVDESYSEDDDENASDEDDDGIVVLDDRNFVRRNKETSKSSLVVAGSGVSSDGESSGGASDQSNLEQANRHLLDEGSSGIALEQSNSEDLNEKCEAIFPVVDQSCPNWENNLGSDGSFESESMVPESSLQNDDISNVVKEPKKVELKLELPSQIKPDVGDELDAQVSDNSILEKLLNFDKYNSTTELEVLGMDRLKMELQARGLKCGGTLPERASRLFLLKITPLDKLPKKLLAKPSSQGK